MKPSIDPEVERAERSKLYNKEEQKSAINIVEETEMSYIDAKSKKNRNVATSQTYVQRDGLITRNDNTQNTQDG